MIIFRTILHFTVVFALIFGCAGRLDYWQGWLLFGNLIIILIIAISLLKDKKELIEERIKPGKGMKWWDKVFYAFFIPLTLMTFVVGSLDTGRFGWTEGFSLWLLTASIILLNLAYAIILWGMLSNPFFSSVVRIQDDRGQTVIKTGPYKYVRHPGYTSGIMTYFAIAGYLGSIYALIPASLASMAFIIRTYLEDKTLQNELEGYKEYTQQVKYRLLPLVW